MAEKKKEVSRRMWLIDPIYRKFTTRAFKALTSNEFYDFFNTMLRNGEHQFQFSNRKLDMRVDERWVEIIEDTIPAFMEITRNPRVLITQEELITNLVQAKRIDSQVVRHLCAHSYLVDAIDENGEVRPGKIMNLLKEETWDTYENRFVYTLLKKTFDFVTKRYRDMKEAMNDEFGATLLIESSANSKLETMSVKSEMKIRQTDDLFDTEDKQKSIFSRIQYIYEVLNKLLMTRFAKEMSKFSIVRPPLVSTNAIKKNPYLRKCHKLWDFLLTYYDVGFTIEIIEQNPEINEKFEQDIFNNIMFTYIILKGYLEDNRDRALDRNAKAQRRTLRPRYIKEIVEEIVQDFNMTDVEVRKVLIEELTKEQLMREEKAERYRLVEERKREAEEKRRQNELERLRKLKEKEREEKRLAREKEQERIRKEKEQERAKERLERERVKREEADARRGDLFEKELSTQMDAVAALRAKKRKADETLAKKAAAQTEKKAKPAAKGKTTPNPKSSTAKKPAKPKPVTELPPVEDTFIPSEEIVTPVQPDEAAELQMVEEIQNAVEAAQEQPAEEEKVQQASAPEPAKAEQEPEEPELKSTETEQNREEDVPAAQPNSAKPIGFAQRLSKLLRRNNGQ